MSSGFGRSERTLVARSGSTSTSSGLTISDTPAVSTRLRLSPGLVAGVVSPATSFTRSRYPVVALSTLPPFLDVETEDEFAHSRRQAPGQPEGVGGIRPSDSRDERFAIVRFIGTGHPRRWGSSELTKQVCVDPGSALVDANSGLGDRLDLRETAPQNRAKAHEAVIGGA